jgi:hypothetical protein
LTETIVKRDAGLDILKGVGCLLMLVAHSNLSLRGYAPFAFYGGLAPAVFFSVSGVAAGFQAARYTARGVLISYLFLFLLGFSFNRITDPGFLQEINFDIIQMIAIGACVVFLMEYFFRCSTWGYLILAWLTFALKFPLMALLQGRIIYGISSIFLPPGIFPVLPWLFLFFLGIFAYRARNFYNLLLALTAGGLFFILLSQGFYLDLENKWDMSFGYFLLCCILVHGSFFLMRALPMFKQHRGMGLLVFLGTSSLLFLYVHFPIILYLKDYKIQHTVYVINHNPYLFWFLALALTVLGMLVLIWLARLKWFARLFDHLLVWLLLTALVFATGLIIRNEILSYWVEIGLGLLFAMFYPRLTRLVKQPRLSTSGDDG